MPHLKAGLDVVGRSKISLPFRDSNPGLSSILPSHCTYYLQKPCEPRQKSIVSGHETISRSSMHGWDSGFSLHHWLYRSRQPRTWLLSVTSP